MYTKHVITFGGLNFEMILVFCLLSKYFEENLSTWSSFTVVEICYTMFVLFSSSEITGLSGEGEGELHTWVGGLNFSRSTCVISSCH